MKNTSICFFLLLIFNSGYLYSQTPAQRQLQVQKTGPIRSVCCSGLTQAQKMELFKDIDKSARLMIIKRVDQLEAAIKRSDSRVLTGFLSTDFVAAGQGRPNSAAKVLPGMLAHFPKAHLILTDIAADNGQFDLRLNLSSFLKLSVVLNKDYKFKEIAVVEELQEDFRETEPALQAERVVFPFHLIDGFILIDGTINHKKGRFMFDTGTPFSFMLNGHYMGFKNTRLVVTGNAGSGQKLSLYYQDFLSTLGIAGQYEITSLKNTLYSDLSFVEPVVGQRFLGFIGHEFFKNYEVTIDYKQQIITLNRLGADGTPLTTLPKAILDDTVATLHFTTEVKQLPTVVFTIGGIKVSGRFDSGNEGEIHLTPQIKKELQAQGFLKEVNNGYDFGTVSAETANYTLKGLVANGFKLDIPFARLVSDQKDELQLGYTFLSPYRSVWNFKRKTIVLLKN